MIILIIKCYVNLLMILDKEWREFNKGLQKETDKERVIKRSKIPKITVVRIYNEKSGNVTIKVVLE